MPLTSARQEVAAAALQGQVWVIGGFADNADPVGIAESYDPKTQRVAAPALAPDSRPSRRRRRRGGPALRHRWLHRWPRPLGAARHHLRVDRGRQHLDHARPDADPPGRAGRRGAQRPHPRDRRRLATAPPALTRCTIRPPTAGPARARCPPRATTSPPSPSRAGCGRWAGAPRSWVSSTPPSRSTIRPPTPGRAARRCPPARGGLAAAALADRVLVFGGEAPLRIFNATEMYEVAGASLDRQGADADAAPRHRRRRDRRPHVRRGRRPASPASPPPRPTRSTRREAPRRSAVALLATVLAAAPAAAQPSRERALADLGRADDVGARRAAVQALAEDGHHGRPAGPGRGRCATATRSCAGSPSRRCGRCGAAPATRRSTGSSPPASSR